MIPAHVLSSHETFHTSCHHKKVQLVLARLLQWSWYNYPTCRMAYNHNTKPGQKLTQPDLTIYIWYSYNSWYGCMHDMHTWHVAVAWNDSVWSCNTSYDHCTCNVRIFWIIKIVYRWLKVAIIHELFPKYILCDDEYVTEHPLVTR